MFDKIGVGDHQRDPLIISVDKTELVASQNVLQRFLKRGKQSKNDVSPLPLETWTVIVRRMMGSEEEPRRSQEILQMHWPKEWMSDLPLNDIYIYTMLSLRELLLL